MTSTSPEKQAGDSVPKRLVMDPLAKSLGFTGGERVRDAGWNRRRPQAQRG